MPRGGHRSGSGRKAGFTHSEITRERILTAKLIRRLERFCLGELKKPMTPSEVSAALGLLAKTLPDLQAIEHSGTIVEEVHTVSAEPLTEEQWGEIYGGSRHN